MSDRFEIPASLEQALEFAKQQPSNAKLGQKKMQDWDVIVKRGRRSLSWSKWKPITAVLAGAAVVVAVVMLPTLQIQNGPGPTTGTTTVAEIDTVKKYEQWKKIYEQQGFKMLSLPNPYGVDIIEDQQGLYSVKNGERKTLLTYEKGQYALIGDQGEQSWPYALLTVYQKEILESGAPNMQDQAYLLNLEDISLKPIQTAGHTEVSQLVSQPDLTLFYLSRDVQGGGSTFYRQDLQTGEERILYQGEDVFEQFNRDGTTWAFGTGKKIVVVSEQGSKVVYQSERKDSKVKGIKHGSYVLYETGLEDTFAMFANSYTGTQKVMMHDLQTGQTRPLLPNVEGDQFWIYTWSATDNGAKVVGNFLPDQQVAQPTDSYKIPGKLQVWEVYTDGREPHLMYEQAMTWGMHWMQGVGPAEGDQGYILESLNHKITLKYDPEKHSITEISTK